MSSYDLQEILSNIKKAVCDIAALMRNRNPIQLGSQIGLENVSGDNIKSLDVESNEIMKKYLSTCSSICRLTSEEEENSIVLNLEGSYYVAFDPLDGSSNIDSNITTGTIYCVFEYDNKNEIIDGNNIVMAGYSLYGGRTLLVNSLYGQVKTYGLATDLTYFILLNKKVVMKSKGTIYALNESNKYKYYPIINKYIDSLIQNKYTARWVGSLVADIHRTVIKGGVIMYPGNTNYPNGKIRLLYEAYPMAYIICSLGGMATNGYLNLLDTPFPNNIHQKTPIFMGSMYEMNQLNNM